MDNYITCPAKAKASSLYIQNKTVLCYLFTLSNELNVSSAVLSNHSLIFNAVMLSKILLALS